MIHIVSYVFLASSKHLPPIIMAVSICYYTLSPLSDGSWARGNLHWKQPLFGDGGVRVNGLQRAQADAVGLIPHIWMVFDTVIILLSLFHCSQSTSSSQFLSAHHLQSIVSSSLSCTGCALNMVSTFSADIVFYLYVLSSHNYIQVACIACTHIWGAFGQWSIGKHTARWLRYL